MRTRTTAARLSCAGSVFLLFLCVLGLGQSARTGDRGLQARCDFNDGSARDWSPNDPAHWKIMPLDGQSVYALTAPGKPGKLRAPTSWSLWTGREAASFEFTGRMLSTADVSNPRRDLCVFFHFQDPAHFYYVHFSASSDDAHNIIGLVNGRDRVKVNSEPAGVSAARLTDRTWHRFKVTYDSRTGKIEAFLDDMTRPVLTARDRTIERGLVGIGSFDDTGWFDDLELWVPAEDPSAQCSIAIEPLGAFDQSRLADLAEGLGKVFVCRIRVLPSLALPSSAFYVPRQRYRADRLLPFLRAAGPADAHILGVTAVDISVTKDQYPDWGVFGLGELRGPACVVSTFRLGRKASARHPLSQRLLKVSIHELGHTFGLPHCPRSSCVMAEYRGSIDNLDESDAAFCARCRTTIFRILQPVDRTQNTDRRER